MSSLAIKFQSDQTAARAMTPEDVLKVLDFYDKYEFTAGLALCDQVLLEQFEELGKSPWHGRDSKVTTPILDLFVEA